MKFDSCSRGTIYVWDCDNSAKIVDSAVEYGKKSDRAAELNFGHIVGTDRRRTYQAHDIHFGATAQKQVLPIVPGLPRWVLS